MQFCYGYQHVKEPSGSPPTGGSPVCHPDPKVWPEVGRMSESGARGIRTPDILLAKQALYQLSYGPDKRVWKTGEPVEPAVGLGGVEPPTSRLSGVRSNHLSYSPATRRSARAGRSLRWERTNNGRKEQRGGASRPARRPAGAQHRMA